MIFCGLLYFSKSTFKIKSFMNTSRVLSIWPNIFPAGFLVKNVYKGYQQMVRADKELISSHSYYVKLSVVNRRKALKFSNDCRAWPLPKVNEFLFEQV